MSESISNKSGNLLLLVSLALIAMNFKFAEIDKLQIPGVPVFVPIVFLWLAWAYFFLAFFNDLKVAGLQLRHRLGKQFNSGLTRWSRRKKDKDRPDLYTPQNLVKPSTKWRLTWEYKYCQIGGNLEPSYTAVSYPVNTIRLFLLAIAKTFFSLDTLMRFTLPLCAGVVALLMKAIFLWLYP